MFVLEL